MAANKTRPSTADVQTFISSVEHDGRREDAEALHDLITKVTGFDPCMWGDAIVGYGSYHYTYESGREGDCFLTGFAPRKTSMTIYIMPGFKHYANELSKLGKHKHSVSCLYVGRLSAIDVSVLKHIIVDSVERMKDRHPHWLPFPKKLLDPTE